jgi:hypothetical protein
MWIRVGRLNLHKGNLMALTNIEIMERVRVMQTDIALNGQAIEGLESSERLQWEMIEKIKDSLSTVKMQISAFGVVNTLVLGWIAWKLTEGMK